MGFPPLEAWYSTAILTVVVLEGAWFLWSRVVEWAGNFWKVLLHYELATPNLWLQVSVLTEASGGCI